MLCEGLYLYKLIVHAFREEIKVVSVHYVLFTLKLIFFTWFNCQFSIDFTWLAGCFQLLPWYLMSLFTVKNHSTTNAGLNQWVFPSGFIILCLSFASRWVDTSNCRLFSIGQVNYFLHFVPLNSRTIDNWRSIVFFSRELVMCCLVNYTPVLLTFERLFVRH